MLKVIARPWLCLVAAIVFSSTIKNFFGNEYALQAALDGAKSGAFSDFDADLPKNDTSASLGLANDTRKSPEEAPFLVTRNDTEVHVEDEGLLFIDRIISKWNISTTSKKERTLLAQIWKRENKYNPNKDLIVFHHPMKSGGTSLSRVLEKMGGVVPGSHESKHFDFKQFKDALGKAASKEQWWRTKRVLFSHSRYRRYRLEKRETLANYLHHNPEFATFKQIQHITMVRDPLAFVASNFYEWFCTLGRWEREAINFDIPKSFNDTCGYTLEDRTKTRIRFVREQCHNLTVAQVEALPARDKELCTAYHEGKADPTPWCASTEAFLASDQFQQIFTNVFAEFTNDGPNATTDDYIYGALEYLGGLDGSPVDGPMMWFGITERMNESACLFHYKTGFPLMKTPRARIKTCRPTNLWAEEDKKQFRKIQVMDYGVFNAANAILDLQLAKMREDLWSRVLKGNETLESMDFTSAECMGPNPMA